MVLPIIESEIDIEKSTSSVYRKIIFDKIYIRIYGDAKYSRTEIKFYKKKGHKRRKIDLLNYLKALNNYLMTHPTYRKYDDKIVNLYDFKCIKFIYFTELKFNSKEFELIENKYPNLLSVNTQECTIYKNSSIGCLQCNYSDYSSDIFSMDSLNGFSGNSIFLKKTHIRTMQQRVLHLNNIYMNLTDVKLNYEQFFLLTDAAKMRKLEINIHPRLGDKDLLFISGFYNLESVQIYACISNSDQIRKLENLREILQLFCINEKELERTKEKRKDFYEKLQQLNLPDEELKSYLMTQNLFLFRKYLDFFQKLYIPRPEKIKWENKINTYELDRIRKELILISNMPIEQRRKLWKEKKENTFLDYLYHLDFDRENQEEEDVVLVNSRVFDTDKGINYYEQRKKIIRL